MKVREWDWNAQAYAAFEYPDQVFAEFIDFLLNVKRWREDPELLYERTRRLERQMAEYRALSERSLDELLRIAERAQFNNEPLGWDSLLVQVRDRERQRQARAQQLKENIAKHEEAAAAAEAATVAAPVEEG